ncbi:hypothetical protein CSKR_113076 [Clonorchis sinensis]|uniref:Uncharacterized protein n=2 Tax=Clonorchis sinensis TaxID=79923 RepID=A0A8T1MEB1_CLOSI|nr:hypothetical protein CSKR_113076 [Clonorchis sinensis]GAA48571.1 AMP dependent ligase [Clonorchis sinensis]
MQAVNESGGEENPRERARRVLSDVLGLQSDTSSCDTPNLKDGDDFYLLGGDSLLAVHAVDSLEKMGFQVDLSTFYETGNIGQILDSLVPPKGSKTDVNQVTKNLSRLAKREESQDSPENVPIEVVEWDGSEPKGEEIKEMLTEIFMQKDVLYMALGLSQADLASVVDLSFMPTKDSIVLLAFCPSLETNGGKTTENRRLVGVLLANPSEHVEKPLPCTSNVNLLLRYLNYCHPATPETNNTPASKTHTLYVSMIGVLSSAPKSQGHSNDSVDARWKRLVLEVLSLLEKKILELAKAKGFTMVERINTSEITAKTSMDSGYRTVRRTCLEDFAFSEHIEVDPKYRGHQSCYMVKDLVA